MPATRCWLPRRTEVLPRTPCQAVEERLYSVDTPCGALSVSCWQPAGTSSADDTPTVITVHPWAVLGGGKHNCDGIANRLARQGLRVLTFNMRSSGLVWGVLRNHSSELAQLRAVCNWASATWSGELVLFGSSAGAPFAGATLASVPQVTKLVAVGYTFGWLSSLAFGRHFRPLLRCDKPKLFIMGERDEFTSPGTLTTMVARAAGRSNEAVVVPGVGHFELESPEHDELVSGQVVRWLGL